MRDYAEILCNGFVLVHEYKNVTKVDFHCYMTPGIMDYGEIEALNRDGIDFLFSGKINEAYKCFCEAINNRNNFAPAINNCGVISFINKDYKKAKSYFEQAYEIIPNQSIVEENFSYVCSMF